MAVARESKYVGYVYSEGDCDGRRMMTINTEKFHGKLTTGERKRVFALLLFATLIRVVYLYLYSRQSIWSDLVVDSLYHLNWADSIAHGNLLGGETYFRAPFYIYVLALSRAMAPDSILLPRAIGSALGVVSVFVTYLLARRTFPGRGGERAGLVAGAMQAMYASVIFFEAELLVDFLFAFLLQLTVYRLLIGVERDTKSAYALAGIALGLACITRPTALALIPFFVFFVYRFGKGAKTQSARANRNAGGALILALVTALVIAPVTIRNYVVGGDLTLVASSGGVNFFIGNNAESSAVSASLPEPYGANWTLADMKGLAERHEGRPLSPAEVSHSWTMRALDWITHHPVEFLGNYFKKLYIALGSREYSNNRSLPGVLRANPVLRYSPLNAALLLFLTVIGMWRLARIERTPAKLLAPVTAGLYVMVLAFFFINERFRLPALILLFPSAGCGLVTLWQLGVNMLKNNQHRKKTALSTGEMKSMTAGIAIATAFAILSALPFGRPVENFQGRDEYLQANGYLNSGQLESAIKTFTELLRENPGYPRAALNLGVAYFLSAKADSARHYFQLELEHSPDNPEALTNLASLALAQGDYRRADSLSQLAYGLYAYDLATFRIRIRALLANRRLEEVDSLLQDGERRFGADVRYWYERMRYCLSLTPPDTTRALEALRRGVALNPENLAPVESSSWAFTRGARDKNERRTAAARIRYQLGYFSGVKGVYDSAVFYSNEALRLDSSLSAAYVNLALGYLSQGFPDSAQQIYQIASERFRQDSVALRDIQRLRGIMTGIQ